MEISAYNSQKLKILGFVAIVLVIFIHSHFIEAHEFRNVEMFQMFTGTFGISGVAVPLYYFISGLLFFKSVKCVKDCTINIKKRARSLLIPYIIWNLVFISWYILFSMIPVISRFVIDGPQNKILTSSLGESLYFLFITPVGFHLWFLRDLIFFTMITPLLYVLIRKVPIVTIILTYVVSCCLSRFGLVYFVIGGYISLHNKLLDFDKLLQGKITLVCLAIYIVNSLIASFSSPYPIWLMNPAYQQIISIISIMAVWGGYNQIVPKKFRLSSKWNDLMNYTFFIYLFHEPVLNIFKKIGIIQLGVNEISLLLLYVCIPFIMLVIALMVGYYWKRLLPTIYGVFTGGR